MRNVNNKNIYLSPPFFLYSSILFVPFWLTFSYFILFYFIPGNPWHVTDSLARCLYWIRWGLDGNLNTIPPRAQKRDKKMREGSRKKNKKRKEKEFVRAVVSCGNKKERIYKTTTITRLGRQELFFLFFWRPYILHSVRRRLIKVYVVAI